LDALQAVLGTDRAGPGWIDTWRIEPLLLGSGAALRLTEEEGRSGIRFALALAALPTGASAFPPAEWLADDEVRLALGANEWQAETYVDRDAFEGFVDVLSVRDAVDGVEGDEDRAADRLGAAEELKARVAAAGWRIGPPDGQRGEP
ncbi:MAG: hypothetical protein M3432_07800, partial [Chloroflexota bacterium]|nr:hypothetical protein [Chloroflexota bacterium]